MERSNAVTTPVRCAWATGEWLEPYHDTEWGVAVHDDRHHFEHLALEAAQAGLSWLTVLKRRDGYRRAFADFDPEKVARYSTTDIERLLGDEGIIRNRQKIVATVKNAQALLDLQAQRGSFDAFLWDFVDGHPLINHWPTDAHIPATSPLSEAASKELKRNGFSFVGPTICYSHFQSAGLIVDHVTTCFRHAQLAG
jgi:DNA-3-methyladenine glycosylase I